VRVRRPVRLVREFDLERREETLRDRVVPAVAAPAHAQDNAVSVEHGAVVAACVLTPAVGMMHEPGVGLAVGQGHRQRLDGELPRDPVAQCPANNAAREQVQDDHEVQPALARPEVRDVGHPGRVRCRDRELPIENVGRHREVMLRVRRALEAALLPRAQALLPHEARHAMAPNVVALCLEFPIDPGTPVAPATGRMGGDDVHGELLILASPRRHRTSSCRIEPGATDPEHRAEQVDRERGLLSRDEGELHPCSLAKKAVAFFSMSRSIRSVFTSRRNCVSSARSSLLTGRLPLRPAATSAWTTQRRSAVSVRSSSRATVLTLFPLSRTTLIASALNSGENDRRRRFFPMTHSYRTFRAVRSVYETRGSPPPIRLALGGLALASRLEIVRLSFQEAAMTVSDVGREGVRLVSRLTGVAISVPVVAGFVLLGAAVLVGRSLLDVGRKLLETKPRAQEPLKAA